MTAERPTGGSGTGPAPAGGTTPAFPGAAAGGAGGAGGPGGPVGDRAAEAARACSAWGWACRPRSRRTSAARSDGCSVTFGRRRPKIVVVVLLAVVSVFFAVIGPKILANAINVIFEGAISKSLPAGVTQDQVVAAATPPARPSSPTWRRRCT